VAFCFSKLEDAQAFAERFDGENLQLGRWRERRGAVHAGDDRKSQTGFSCGGGAGCGSPMAVSMPRTFVSHSRPALHSDHWAEAPSPIQGEDALVVAEREVAMAGGKPIEVVRIKITAAGRRAIGAG
jgi:hypothetical protein